MRVDGVGVMGWEHAGYNDDDYDETDDDGYGNVGVPVKPKLFDVSF